MKAKSDSKTRAHPGETQIATEASAWFLRREAGLDAAAERQFQTWREADPRHEEALSRLAATWAVFDRAEEQGASSAILARLEVRAVRRRRQRTRAAAMAGGVGLLLLSFGMWLQDSSTSPTATAVTAVSFDPIRRLPDGSIVELNHGAEIAVHYQPSVRRVRLVRGEAHFRVEKDSLRAFVVETAGVDVRAVGTAFTVQLRSEMVEVVVTQGTVALERTGPEPPHAPHTATKAPARVEAGNRALVFAAPVEAAMRIESMTSEEIEQRLAWRRTHLQFSGTDVASAVALMNQHNRLQIAVADASIGQLRVSGVFRSDNPEGFLRILLETFNLRAERPAEDRVLLLQPAP